MSVIMRLWMRLSMGLILSALLVSNVSLSSEVLTGSKAAGLESCVAPTEDMRRNHMKYLFHKRDKTMREGVRTEKFGLNNCVSCHAAKGDDGHFVPVTDEGQFCQSCHERASQKLDCFSCHRTTPDTH